MIRYKSKHVLSITLLFAVWLLPANSAEFDRPFTDAPPSTESGVYAEDDSGQTSAQKVQRRIYFPNGKLQKLQTLTRDENGKFIEHGVEVELYPSGKLKSRGLLVYGERSGKWVFVGETGHITQGDYQDGKRAGAWKVWSADKQILISEHYLEDALHGPRQTFHPNGKNAVQSFFSRGLKHGAEVFWHPSGVKASEGAWVYGERHGDFKKWHLDGKLLVEGHYFVGIPTGLWKWYDLKGQERKTSDFLMGTGRMYEYTFVPATKESSDKLIISRETDYKDGKLHGPDVTYHSNGNLKAEYYYKDGLYDGRFREWYASAHLRVEGNYSVGKPIDTIREYYPPDADDKSRKPVLAKETVYEDGLANAMVAEYSPEGVQLSVMFLNSGEPDGDFKAFFPDGTIMRSGHFLGGMKDGEWKEFYPNGKLHSLQDFSIDKENGRYEVWYESLADVESDVEANVKIRGSFVNGERDGVWQSWYPDGSMRTEVLYRNGVEDGVYKEWWPENPEEEDEDPFLKTEGTFVLGEKDGEWKIWHRNGLLQSRGIFRKGVQDGIAEEWYNYHIKDEPVLKLRGEYKNGKEAGLWEAYFGDAQLELSQTFQEGQLEGERKQYYATGTLKSIESFKNGQRHGRAYTYHPNGKDQSQVEFVDARRHGPYQLFHENGKLRTKGSYHYNIPEGLWQWFDEDGETILASSQFVKGKGAMYEFFPIGQKAMETEYVDGIEHGKQIRWFQNGHLRSEATFHRGLIHGAYKEYHESGQPLMESTWIFGQRNGTHLSWYGNQQQQMSLFFVNGVLHGQHTEWYENGNVKATGSWLQGKRHGEWLWNDRYGDQILKEDYDMGLLVHSVGDKSQVKE